MPVVGSAHSWKTVAAPAAFLRHQHWHHYPQINFLPLSRKELRAATTYMELFKGSVEPNGPIV
jgi:hypothetical protein